MRSFTAILLASITSTFAYQVTSPGDAQGWTTSGPNSLTWVRVDTDPLNFTAVLTNQAVMPQGPQVLNALVDGTLGQIICNPPSGGWPQGSGFRVNLAKDAEDLNTLLAQSNQFNINSTTSSGSSSATSGTSSVSYPTTAVTPTTAVASSTTSDTSTTPTSTSGAIIGMNVETGFLTAVAALAAFITTHF
ncbi:uncharacterized protein EDB91DRAFT_1234598 [Suillus paluster]|uniref:uncharacterized protein n=1 Tax=Suillus paluster TaxID=48578 RepID=UPI001B88596F|nr:uncharacterized protein EDB91DRAFT_1234598 [Suillus paluster]KAG1752608.1 hypothetical protein EDB91DRAFT_1234598 [Suillus paluster]